MSPKINIHNSISPSQDGDEVTRRILYINPNSTLAFTQETFDHLAQHHMIPRGVRVDFYTAPSESAPPSIDGTFDGVLSTVAILRDLEIVPPSSSRIDTTGMDKLRELAKEYEAIVVACFSMHPLVPCLKEAFGQLSSKGEEGSVAGLSYTPKIPKIVGIMEASIEIALRKRGKFGIATTGTCKLGSDLALSLSHTNHPLPLQTRSTCTPSKQNQL
jgi:Asp/Glu/hydantoin racemase